MDKTFMQTYTWAATLAGVLLTAACSEETPVPGNAGGDTSSEVQFIVKTVGTGSVNISSRAGEELDMSDPRNHFPVGYDFIKGKSRIRVCSVSRDTETKYNLPDMDAPFKDKQYDEDPEYNPNGYHEYICLDKKDYEEYSTFKVYDDGTNKGVPCKVKRQICERGFISKYE